MMLPSAQPDSGSSARRKPGRPGMFFKDRRDRYFVRKNWEQLWRKARLRLTEKKITAPWPLPLFPFLCGFPRYGILLSIKIAAFCAGRAGRTILRIGNKKGIFMERTFQKAVKQVAKYPILSIVAGAVALFSLVAFFFQLGNLFSVAGWFGDMVAWYMRDFSHLLGNLGSIFENGLYLLSCFFYVLQFLGTLALVGLLWGCGRRVSKHQDRQHHSADCGDCRLLHHQPAL